MTAMAVGQMKVHPGKDREYVALMQEWKSLAAKHGLNPRLLVSVFAGPDVGVYTGVYEAADLVTLITGFQALSADPAFQSLRQRLYGPDGVCTLLSFSQATEISL